MKVQNAPKNLTWNGLIIFFSQPLKDLLDWDARLVYSHVVAHRVKTEAFAQTMYKFEYFLKL